MRTPSFVKFLKGDARFFDPDRVKDLGDGIFAFAMTLLIVSIEIPNVPIDQLKSELISRLPDFFTFTLTFMLLAIFWMTNHIQMKKVKSTDGRLVWINMFLYLFVVFMPFSTHLYTFYDGSKLAMLIFNSNIIFIGTCFVLQWHHLAVNNLHHEEFTKEEIRDRYELTSAMVIVALLAILIGWFYPTHSTSVYLILFMYRIYLRFKGVSEGGKKHVR
jgi:uncharacterized membrane protein